MFIHSECDKSLGIQNVYDIAISIILVQPRFPAISIPIEIWWFHHVLPICLHVMKQMTKLMPVKTHAKVIIREQGNFASLSARHGEFYLNICIYLFKLNCVPIKGDILLRSFIFPGINDTLYCVMEI